MKETVPPFIGYGTSHIGCIEETVPHHIYKCYPQCAWYWPRDLFGAVMQCLSKDIFEYNLGML